MLIFWGDITSTMRFCRFGTRNEVDLGNRAWNFERRCRSTSASCVGVPELTTLVVVLSLRSATEVPPQALFDGSLGSHAWESTFWRRVKTLYLHKKKQDTLCLSADELRGEPDNADPEALDLKSETYLRRNYVTSVNMTLLKMVFLQNTKQIIKFK